MRKDREKQGILMCEFLLKIKSYFLNMNQTTGIVFLLALYSQSCCYIQLL
uniref:Uncharacterized protein n=1 Tax=Rhizophora mucronata TaxID=61149 RepID=A0A2P2PMK2_RHIMU